MKDKIVEILMVDLQGCDRNTIYCNTCRGGKEDDDVEDRCNECIRKQMYWGISRKYAEEIADEILKEINNNIMIDFKEKARIAREADETLKKILSNSYDTFDQYLEVSKIEDLEVAKLVIKRLLDKVNEKK